MPAMGFGCAFAILIPICLVAGAFFSFGIMPHFCRSLRKSSVGWVLLKILLTPIFGAFLFILFWVVVFAVELHASKDYWNYKGAYDWYRMPLEYPYELTMIDRLDNASVDIWADSGVRKEVELDPIRKVCKYEGMLVGTTSYFHREIGREDTSWFILDLGTGSVEEFSSEGEFHDRLAERGISVPPNLVTLSEYWDSYWAK